jgi:hypothetical protein
MSAAVEDAPVRRVAALQRLAEHPLLWPALLVGALGAGYAAATGLAALADDGTPRAPSPWYDPRWLSFEVHQLVLIGISLAGIGYAVRSALRALRELAAAGRVEPPRAAALAAELTRVDLRLVALVATLSILAAVSVSSYTPVWTSGVTPELLNPWRLWFMLRMALTVGLALSWMATLERQGMRLVQAAGGTPLDLLDPEPFAPIGRKTTTDLLLWVAYLGLLGFLFVLPSPREVSLLALALAAAASAGVFARPLAALHARLRDARERELSAVRAAIRAERAREASPPGRLADLLAWEAHVAGVRTHPLAAGGLARLGLFAAVALASWVGAALVERVLALVLR